MVASAERPPAPTAPRKDVSKQSRELQVGVLYPRHTLVCVSSLPWGWCQEVTRLPPHQAQVKELDEKLRAARESARSARSAEKSLKGEVDRLTSDLQTCRRERKRLQDEGKEREKEMQELQRRNSTFKSALQVRSGAARRSTRARFTPPTLDRDLLIQQERISFWARRAGIPDVWSL